jgi:hypothetical protein
MTLADVIDYAKYAELAQLSVVKQLDSTTTAEVVKAEKQIISYINLALIELYKRFNLRTEQTVVVLDMYETMYTLDIPELNEILAAYDEKGRQYFINSENDELSILTPNFNTIQVPNPVQDEAIFIIYSAAPVRLVWQEDLTLQTVKVPPNMLEPLLHYVGYRAHGALNGEINAENNTHYMRFESSCAKLKEMGVFSDDALVAGTKLEDKGFV